MTEYEEYEKAKGIYLGFLKFSAVGDRISGVDFSRVPTLLGLNRNDYLRFIDAIGVKDSQEQKEKADEFYAVEYPILKKHFWKIQNELFLLGIIYNEGDCGGGFLKEIHLTTYGKKWISNSEPSPYLAQRYLDRLFSLAGPIDQIIRVYAEEALNTFHKGCPVASAILLGCASERMVCLLVAKFPSQLTKKKIPDLEKDQFGKILKGFLKTLKELHEAKEKAFFPEWDDVPETLSIILNVSEDLRIDRNSGAHLNFSPLTVDAVHAKLLIFPKFIEHSYRLLNHWKKLGE